MMRSTQLLTGRFVSNYEHYLKFYGRNNEPHIFNLVIRIFITMSLARYLYRISIRQDMGYLSYRLV